jgi:hypothetical protein
MLLLQFAFATLYSNDLSNLLLNTLNNIHNSYLCTIWQENEIVFISFDMLMSTKY